jgi:hypothetical protein
MRPLLPISMKVGAFSFGDRVHEYLSLLPMPLNGLGHAGEFGVGDGETGHFAAGSLGLGIGRVSAIGRRHFADSPSSLTNRTINSHPLARQKSISVSNSTNVIICRSNGISRYSHLSVFITPPNRPGSNLSRPETRSQILALFQADAESAQLAKFGEFDAIWLVLRMPGHVAIAYPILTKGA